MVPWKVILNGTLKGKTYSLLGYFSCFVACLAWRALIRIQLLRRRWRLKREIHCRKKVRPCHLLLRGPTESFIIQQSKKIDVCGHFNEKCVAESKAILCDFCHSWTHASCEGLKDEQYNQLTQLTSRVENISYYCNLNQCAVAHKKLLYECLCKVTLSEDVLSINIACGHKLHPITCCVSLRVPFPTLMLIAPYNYVSKTWPPRARSVRVFCNKRMHGYH